jgi:hypothetical protein
MTDQPRRKRQVRKCEYVLQEFVDGDVGGDYEWIDVEDGFADTRAAEKYAVGRGLKNPMRIIAIKRTFTVKPVDEPKFRIVETTEQTAEGTDA